MNLQSKLISSIIGLFKSFWKSKRVYMSGPDAYFDEPELKRLAIAVAEGKSSKIKLILSQGTVAPSALGRDGTTLLTIAILSNQREAFEMLLKAGAIGEPTGKTAGESMYTATLADSDYWLKRLIESGADLNNFGGGNLLIVQAMKSRLPGRLQIYLDSGANLEATTNLGGTIALESARIGRFDVTNLLLDRGASIWAIDKIGTTIGYRAEAAAKVPTWDVKKPMEKQRHLLVEKLMSAGFPQPAPTLDEAINLKQEGNWPPIGGSSAELAGRNR